MIRSLIGIMRSGLFVCVIICSAQCAYGSPLAPSPSAAPANPNKTVVKVRVLDAVIVDSLALNISPQQPLSVLTLKFLQVKQVGDRQILYGQSGETIRAYSKDLSLVGLKGNIIAVTLSFRGDERGGSFWVTASPGAAE